MRFSQEPADQSVVLGERVVLSCVVFNYTGIVQWTKDGLALGIGEGLRGERGEGEERNGELEGENYQRHPAAGIKAKRGGGMTPTWLRFSSD